MTDLFPWNFDTTDKQKFIWFEDKFDIIIY